MRSQLENCLADGTPLLVTDCDISELVNDKRFQDTIRSSYRFIGGKSRFKVIVSSMQLVFTNLMFNYLFLRLKKSLTLMQKLRLT